MDTALASVAAQAPSRAAQYVRMSIEHQKYSLENPPLRSMSSLRAPGRIMIPKGLDTPFNNEIGKPTDTPIIAV
jgi:hypothetical protein